MSEFFIGALIVIPIGWLAFAYGVYAREIAKGLSVRPTDLGGWLVYALVLFFVLGCVVASLMFASAIFHTGDRVFGATVAAGALWLWLRKK